MMNHEMDRLSAYLDDELSADERREVDGHLDNCAECRDLLADLRSVIAEARALEPGEPRRDLWPAIVARIETERDVTLPLAGAPARTRRFSFTVPQLAAASLALILVSGASAWMLGRAADTQVAAVVPADGVTAVPAGLSGGRRADSTAAQVQRLEGMLLTGETQLDPETIGVLRRNLLIIDQALIEAGAALDADPANPYLTRHYQNTMQKKLELLRQAGSIGRGNT